MHPAPHTGERRPPRLHHADAGAGLLQDLAAHRQHGGPRAGQGSAEDEGAAARAVRPRRLWPGHVRGGPSHPPLGPGRVPYRQRPSAPEGVPHARLPVRGLRGEVLLLGGDRPPAQAARDHPGHLPAAILHLHSAQRPLGGLHRPASPAPHLRALQGGPHRLPREVRANRLGGDALRGQLVPGVPGHERPAAGAAHPPRDPAERRVLLRHVRGGGAGDLPAPAQRGGEHFCGGPHPGGRTGAFP
mmetsp:Transcript_31100/g.67940  ORF Transcript_31100/g.67940 Transcript_31100/m.67940 type:complete len:244 (+) Transcript_31100:581-1312(+)